MRHLAAVALALASATLGGCAGIGGDDDVRRRVSGPSLVTRDQIERQPVDSPARTFLEWWRTIQFDNPVAAAHFYSADLGITPKGLERQLKFGAFALELNARPRLVEVKEDAGEATVVARLEDTIRRPNRPVETIRTPRAFELVREDGEWKLAENGYLERGARIQRERQARAENP